MNKASRVIQRSRDYFQFARQLQDGTRASHEPNLDSIRQADLAPYSDPKQPLRVLDLANGHLRTNTIFCAQQDIMSMGLIS